MDLSTMSGVYLHVRQHAFASAFGLMAWLKSLEAVIAAFPSPQHLYGGVQKLGGVGDRLALHWVPDFLNRLIGTFGVAALLDLLHKTFSTALPCYPTFRPVGQNGFTPAIGLQSMVLADNLVHSQSLFRVGIAF